MGIDFEKFERVSQSIELQSSKEDSELRKQIANHRSGSGGQLILSIDRLDYTKGILNRIEAFELFLKRYPEYHGKVRLVMIIVPSRSEVPHYQKLKKQTDESIGRVNGEYSTINWTPIWYYYRSFEFEDLISLYKSCEIAMVTPLRDGMNLVAKEFLATKLDAKGTLILSELAGASKELHNALLVNPFDIDQLAETIYEALNLSEPEQVERNTPMRQRIKRYDIHAWAKRFMETLINKEQEHHQEPTIKINSTVKETITKAYNSALNRLILLDYDGTLTGFHTNHHKAVPSQQLLNALEKLSKNNDLAIISGRAPDFLEKHFGNLSIDLIAEHGHIRKLKGETPWAEQNHSNDEWVAHLLPVMQQFADNTPGTFVEVKRNALVWHYRKTDPELGIVKSEELKTILASMVSNEVHLMSGDKIVEVVSSSVNKGTAALERYHHSDYDFVLVAGDDVTDEDMFTYLPSKNTFSIKVGNKATSANYRIADSNQMVDLLDSLVTTNE
jgi:trehalose 6-phosphate synthase/phosphatase